MCPFRAYISVMNANEYSYTNEASIILPLITMITSCEESHILKNFNDIQLKSTEISQFTSGICSITISSYEMCVKFFFRCSMCMVCILSSGFLCVA